MLFYILVYESHDLDIEGTHRIFFFRKELGI